MDDYKRPTFASASLASDRRSTNERLEHIMTLLEAQLEQQKYSNYMLEHIWTAIKEK